MLKNGFLTFLCAFIPGAGQMYQGYMKRGLSLLLVLCCIGFASALVPPLAIFILVVWMYSFFDTFNLRALIATGTASEDDYLFHFDPKDRRVARFILDSHKHLGWLLIAIGSLAAYENIFMKILDDVMWNWGQNRPGFRAFYLVMQQLPQVVVCVVIILCGVWLVRSPKGSAKPASPENAPEEPDFREYHPADEASAPNFSSAADPDTETEHTHNAELFPMEDHPEDADASDEPTPLDSPDE